MHFPLTVHPSHQASLKKVGGFVLFLALVQLILGSISIPDQFNYIKHYLVYHSIMEVASVVISMMVFIIGWNAQTHKQPGGLVFLSVMFLCVGLMDGFHLLSYGGMPDFFSHNDAEKHLNFWLTARFIAAIGLLLVSISFLFRKSIVISKYLLLSLSLTFVLWFAWLVINDQSFLPNWFIPGEGLTPLKKHFEYVIISINLLTAAILLLQLKHPNTWGSPMLIGAVIIMALSELFFTWYTTMTGVYNILGHLYKLIAYFMVYKAIVSESLETPYKQLKQSQENLDLAITASNIGLWRWQVGGEHLYMSPVLKEQIGYQDNELPNNISALHRLIHPEDKARFMQDLENYISSSNDDIYKDEFRLLHKNGHYRWIYSQSKKLFNENQHAVELIGTHSDITERKLEEERFQASLQASPNAMFMVDDKGIIVLTNTRANELFGYGENDLIGEPIHKLVPKSAAKKHPKLLNSFFAGPMKKILGEGRYLYALHKDGHEFRVEIGLTPIKTSEGHYVLASVVDITERVEAQARIDKLMNYDQLTELPNRQLLKERGEFIISQAKQHNAKVGFVYIGLDGFKYLNDSFGHLTGDQILIRVVNRLKKLISSADMIARVVADEFAIIISDASADEMARLAKAINNAILEPFKINNDAIVVTCSVGVSLFPDDSNDFESLLQHADIAMEKVKEDAKNGFLFFSDDLQQTASRAIKIDSALRSALQNQELHLHYQPQICIGNKQFIGVEVLLRWTHPELGDVSPAEFIPRAELNGTIIPIGKWVLRTAMQQLKQWLDEGYEPFIMAINLSAVQFKHENINDMVASALEEFELPPEYLELELTETGVMENPDKAVDIMEHLHNQGIRFALDDFGTGYSSLSYLKKFNIDKLKIDQSFVRDIATDEDDRAIVKTIIQMAASLGFKTIAEGVETESQFAFLHEHGCDEYQGYMYSKPIPAKELQENFLCKRTDID